MRPTNAEAEREIRAVIEAWMRAVQARDIAGVLARHTEDMVMFDVPPPVEVRGLNAYRDTWPPFFSWQEEEDGTFEITSLEITAGSDVAFAAAVLRCGSKADLADDDTPKLRLTIGLRKEAGQWLIAHEHHSFPLDAE